MEKGPVSRDYFGPDLPRWCLADYIESVHDVLYDPVAADEIKLKHFYVVIEPADCFPQHPLCPVEADLDIRLTDFK